PVPSARRHSRLTPAIIGGLPPRNTDFVGREELLASIRERLADAVVALIPPPGPGPGGEGRSQLALEYAHKFASEYDLIWWMPAGQPVVVRSALTRLGRRLGLH